MQEIRSNQLIFNKNSSLDNEAIDRQITNLKAKIIEFENKALKAILGDFKNVEPSVLHDGIQKVYDLEELKNYQIELIKLQNYLEAENKRMIILFEGRDASGKGGAIRRITRYMNNKHYRIVALGKPTETQRNQWFFQLLRRFIRSYLCSIINLY